MADVPDPQARNAEVQADVQASLQASLQAELAAVRAEMQHFSYAVSHDLRAPLRHILSYAQLVQEDAGPLLSAEVQEFLTTITDSARHMGMLLDGLAAVARMGTVPVDITAVSLQELVQAVCQELDAQHPQRAITWRIADDFPTVQADAALLHQALAQVLGNAVKFSASRESAVIGISTVPAQSDAFVCLQVNDNGVGYNPALQDQLFKVFGRLHGSQQFEGIGMGLVLTRKMLERFGAMASIHGVLDGGCKVQLMLPRA